MPMQETRQESKTVPLHQPAAPAGPAQTANTSSAVMKTLPCWKRR